jgi:hypothetical protein
VFLRRRGGGDLPEPLNDARCTFYFKGRNAVWHAVKALKLTPQETILVPSYHCGADLDAIIKTGAKVEFYRVDRSATIDLEHLQRSINANTRALFHHPLFWIRRPTIDGSPRDVPGAQYPPRRRLRSCDVFKVQWRIARNFGGRVRVQLIQEPSGASWRRGAGQRSIVDRRAARTEPPAAEGFDMVHWSMEAHLRAKLGILGAGPSIRSRG